MSKADRSMNWREPAPKRQPAPASAWRARPFRTNAFAKKPALPVNPFPPAEGLWYDFAEFSTRPMKFDELPKCGLCLTILKKTSFPQRLNCCEDVFCAACIYKHYFTEKKKQCPCCEEYICYEEDPEYCRECCCAPCRCAEFEMEEQRELYLEQMGDDDEECCRYCGPLCSAASAAGACFCEEERACGCGWAGAGDCGCLPCGCTDVCKGRCDPDYYD